MSKKLLLADDSITIQKVIQITFAHEDYELAITDNGDAAFAKAQEIKPDLVMADVYMPGKNGYELTTAIRQDDTLKNIPVLLLAGSFEPFDEDKARSCQANAWIEKPFESQNLIDKVAELLDAAPAEPAPAEPAPAPAAAEPAEELPEESPVASFDGQPEPAAEEAAATSEDPFGDISFEEETPAVQAFEPANTADDWSDVAAAPEAEGLPDVSEENAAEPADDFTFAEELPDIEEPATAEVPPAAVEDDPFAIDEDEIMPLDDDDILGAEDLEPAPPEQTLASWSRDAAPTDDVFGETLAEESAAEEDVFAVEETPASVVDTSAVDETPVFEEPEQPVFEESPEETPLPEVSPPVSEQLEDVFAEPAAEEPVSFAEPVAEEPVFVEEAESSVEAVPAAVNIADVEKKAASLSEEEIEKIIEKVVAGVVEKLAGTILERVAWEVVPDLAENLIKEEIRKIKDAAA